MVSTLLLTQGLVFPQAALMFPYKDGMSDRELLDAIVLLSW